MLAAIALVLALADTGAPPAPRVADVLRALPPVTRGLPFVVGEFHDDLVIVMNLVKQTAVRGQVESRWECVAYFTSVVELGFPFGATLKKNCVQVVYLDTHTTKPAGR